MLDDKTRVSVNTVRKPRNMKRARIKKIVLLYVTIVFLLLAIGPWVFPSNWISSIAFRSGMAIALFPIAPLAGVACLMHFFGLANRKVERRITLLNHLNEDLLRLDTLESKLRCITDGVVEIFDADFCRIWISKAGDLCDSNCIHARIVHGPHVCRERDRCLHLMASSGRYTHIDGETHRRVPFGCYKIGRVAAGDDSKFLTNDVTHDPRVHDHNWAKKLDLVSFAGYRLLSDTSMPIGVFALFSKHAVSPEEDALLGALANTIAQVIQKAAIHEALRRERDFDESLFETAQTIILALNIDGRIVRFNTYLEEMSGHKLEDVRGKDWFTTFLPKRDRQSLRELLSEASKDTQACRGVSPIVTKDGREREIEWYYKALKDVDGNVTGVLGVGQDITERRRIEKELARRQGDLEAILEAAPVGMLLVDKDLVVVQANDMVAKLAGQDASTIVGSKPGEGLRCIHASDDIGGCGHGPWCSVCPLRSAVEKVLQSGKAISGVEAQVTFLVGGKEVCPWLEISVAPVTIGGSEHAIVAISNITQRKESQAQLKATQEKLIETAHRAGMAEVATDVLHNVGNVLNSVNISTTLITEKITYSELENLRKVVNLINDNSDNLGTFLTEDAKGKHIPAYLTEISKYLQDEQADIINRLRVLADNVEHIREIVSTQQSYAKAVGVEVQVSLAELVEDAIQINSAGLERHGTQLTRDFEELPDIHVDKQKVLQILVNLISNAKYALSDSDKEKKLLTVRIRKHGECNVRVEVADNGVGVPKENLTRIFSHGYTTKQYGHGFGLHSSALAAKGLGGSLSVQSDGIGNGATFTLGLPLKRVKAMK
jgi:PAS domain S-box-containing protein